MSKGELFLETHSKIASTSVRDITQDGIKIEFNSNSESKGKYNSRGIGTTTVWNKTDGTAEWETKGLDTTDQGESIAVWGKGTGKNTGPTTQMWSGEMHFMSQSPKLAWLNSAKIWVEGSGDQAKGEAHGKFYLQK